MKKLRILLLTLFVIPAICNAQIDEDFFPNTGTKSIGLDLGYLLKGISNFGEDDIDNIVKSYQSAIFLRTFLSKNLALRTRLDIGINNSKTLLYVRDDNTFRNDPMAVNPVTIDTRKERNTYFELGVGLEYRHNVWRLQGYCGGELFGGANIKKLHFEYGNAITAENKLPSTANFGNNFISQLPNQSPTSNMVYNGYRILDYDKLKTITLGVAAFVGVDFFICKNISIGPEFRLAASYNFVGESNAITEEWSSITNDVSVGEQPIYPKSSFFTLKPTGYLNLMFYF
ncbi:MAG: hypothetical protein LBP67_01935 [Bacteroidales bacterium]|jgi:hypothetical protein|nr:hypothetical protein [Bacteroidales bacterium]